MIQNLPTLCKAIKTWIETQSRTCSYPDRTSHNSRQLRHYIGCPVRAPRVSFKMAALRRTTFTVYSVCARLARVSSRLLSYEQNGQDKTSAQPLTEGEETNTVLSQANNSLNGWVEKQAYVIKLILAILKMIKLSILDKINGNFRPPVSPNQRWEKCAFCPCLVWLHPWF